MKRKRYLSAIIMTALLISGCTGNNTAAISEEDAKKIVLDQVGGSTLEDIRAFQSDYDNGKLKYEGNLYHGQQKIEFEIDGYDGSILEWDVEPIREGF